MDCSSSPSSSSCSSSSSSSPSSSPQPKVRGRGGQPRPALLTPRGGQRRAKQPARPAAAQRRRPAEPEGAGASLAKKPRALYGRAAELAERAKENPTPRRLAAVSKLLRSAENLPASCRRMLVAALPRLLPAAPGDGEPCQLEVAAILDSSIAELGEFRQRALQEADARVAEAAVELAAREAARGQAAADLEAKQEECHRQAMLLEDAEFMAAGTEDELTASRRSLGGLAAELREVAEEKARLEEAVRAALDPLCRGDEGASQEEQARLLERFCEMARPVALEESLVKALHVTLLRPARLWGRFDLKVVAQVRKVLAAHTGGLGQRIAEAPQREAETLHAVGRLEGMLGEARGQQDVSAKALSEGTSERKFLEITLRKRQRAVGEIGQLQRKLAEEAHAAKVSLDIFRTTLVDYQALRGQAPMDAGKEVEVAEAATISGDVSVSEPRAPEVAAEAGVEEVSPAKVSKIQTAENIIPKARAEKIQDLPQAATPKHVNRANSLGGS